MSDNFTQTKSVQPSHLAYTVSEGKDNQQHWSQIGAAWKTKDDGLSLQLNSLPVDGKVVLRSREELDKMRRQKQQSQSQQSQDMNLKQ